MTERMAVQVTVYLDVPDDITEEGMDDAARDVAAAIRDDLEYDAVVLSSPVLVDYVGGVA